MSLSFYVRAFISIFVGCVFASLPARGADVRKGCYTIGDTAAFSVPGDVFRQALLSKTNATIRADERIRPSKPPAGLRQCSVGKGGGGPPEDIPKPDATNYFGTLSTRIGFRRFSQRACDGRQAPFHRFFSMGDAIYYRKCTGGDGNGYVYFWGVSNDVRSDCFADDYPTMFAAATADKKNPVTLTTMSDSYTNGLRITGPSSYALGNAMAAILIAEAYRDVLVVPENYMLMDAPNVDPASIIGGHCPSGLQAGVCQNKQSPQDGLHPLAWGGAQNVMMANGGWGFAGGATSDFGQSFEANLIVSWLLNRKARGVEPAKPLTCDPKQKLGSLTAAQQTAVGELFADLLPSK